MGGLLSAAARTGLTPTRALANLGFVGKRARRQLIAWASAILVASGLSGCSSKNPCQDPLGEGCGRSQIYPNDDPRSVCHVCCQSDASGTDAWTELSQTDIGSTQFSAYVLQNHPVPGDATFSGVQAIPFTNGYFSFDGQVSGLQYHLLTRGRQSEGDLQLYYSIPGYDGPVSAAPMNCTIARN